MIDAARGVVSSGSIADDLWQETWGLSQTGNWLGHDLDLDGDGSNELESANTFTLANEWDERDTNSSAPAEHTLVYDAVGNLTSDDDAYDYKYDAYGRLRFVYETGTTDVVAEYRYNGLNQRITAHYDTDTDGDVDGNDVVSHFVYDQRWRIVARYEDANTDPTEQWVHHHAGLVSSGSGSYIDSVILRDRDTTGNGTLDERVYYLQNWRSDVVALITDTGDQREQVRYEPYGTPFGLPAGDIDSDGDFDSTDVAGTTGTYDVRKDSELDGDVDFNDIYHAAGIAGAYQTLGRGVLTSPAIDNRRGYAGYESDPTFAGANGGGAAARTIYHVRHRVYDADVGRWTRRDPLGYSDGMSLYAYVQGLATTTRDPLGLQNSAQPACQPPPPGVHDWRSCAGLKHCVAGVEHKPGIPAKTNGCGSAFWNQLGLVFLFPAFIADFSQCCDGHDLCYGTCGSEKNQCDNWMFECLMNVCQYKYSSTFNRYTLTYERCIQTADVVRQGVQKYGRDPFCAAQQKNCKCKGPPAYLPFPNHPRRKPFGPGNACPPYIDPL